MPLKLRTNNLTLFYPFDIDTNDYSSGSAVVNGNTQNSGASIQTKYTRNDYGSLYLSNNYSSPNTGQYFQINNITPTNVMTFSVWMKINSFPTTSNIWSRIFDFGNGSPTNNILLGLYANETTAPYYFTVIPSISNTSTPAILQPGTSDISNYKIKDKNWHHYCITINQSTTLTMKLYIDGYLYYNNSSNTLYTLTTLQNCYIGKSNWSNDYNVDAYFNNFVYYNREITQSEMGLLFGIKNTILNGTFNQFYLKGITGDTIVGYSQTSINNNKSSYTASNQNWGTVLSNNIIGWDISNNYGSFSNSGGNSNNSNILLLNCNSGYLDISLNNQSYMLGIQTNITSTTSSVLLPLVKISQYVYLDSGNYNVSFFLSPRSKDNTNRGGLSSINIRKNSNNTDIALYDQNGLAKSSYLFLSNHKAWEKYYYTIRITTPDIYLFSFNFTTIISLSSPYTTGDTSFFITNITIQPSNNILVYNTTDVESSLPTTITQSSIGGFSTNYDFSFNQYLLNGNPIFQKKPFYMHGIRNKYNFQINEIDIGYYYQQSSVFDGSYNYCFVLPILFESNTFTYVDSFVKTKTQPASLIWPENSIYPQVINQKVAYWLYYTFYSSSNTTASLYAAVDDYATIYINSTNIGNCDTDTPINNKSITINIGLNYIRVACYNDGNQITGNPSYFIAAVYDTNNNLLVKTDSNWTWSSIPIDYASPSLYNNIYGSLPFNTYTPSILTNATYNTYMFGFTLFYIITDASNNATIRFPSNITRVNYLIVGGGGAGGNGITSLQNSGFYGSYAAGGGGGGGEVKGGSLPVNSDDDYPITVVNTPAVPTRNIPDQDPYRASTTTFSDVNALGGVYGYWGNGTNRQSFIADGGNGGGSMYDSDETWTGNGGKGTILTTDISHPGDGNSNTNVNYISSDLSNAILRFNEYNILTSISFGAGGGGGGSTSLLDRNNRLGGKSGLINNLFYGYGGGGGGSRNSESGYNGMPYTGMGGGGGSVSGGNPRDKSGGNGGTGVIILWYSI